MQSNKEKGKCMTKVKVMESLKFLQDAQLLAYKEAITDEHDNAERLRLKGTDEAEERFQLRVHIAMAKSRDKLYLEQGVSEADIDTTIKELNLELDKDF
jgi:two-component sensor histidine kinase